jgi:hypothetical protein
MVFERGKEFFMSIIADSITAILVDIRLFDAGIASMQSGHGTQTRTIGENLHDDTAESIAWMMECKTDLCEAYTILTGAL